MDGKYTLPQLPYAYDALEPHYDAETLEIHHSKHHQGYVNGLNSAIEELTEARRKGDFKLIKHLEREIAFHGGGHELHSIFWRNLSQDGGGRPGDELATAIDKEFGSYDLFDAQMRAATAAVEGSGWGALVVHPASARLAVLQIENHHNNIIPGWNPILVIDVWEHAYYLKYRNRRADFVGAVMDHLVDWSDVSGRYERFVTS
jgi:superoxide dismutase, Fe-Mn family